MRRGVILAVDMGNNKGVVFVIHGGSHVLQGVMRADHTSKPGVAERSLGSARGGVS